MRWDYDIDISCPQTSGLLNTGAVTSEGVKAKGKLKSAPMAALLRNIANTIEAAEVASLAPVVTSGKVEIKDAPKGTTKGAKGTAK